jgi:hypothetical protein
MSADKTNAGIAFSPFHALLQEGIDRLFEFFPSDPFTFHLRAHKFECTIAEAVLISPIVCNSIQCDSSCRAFHCSDERVDTETFASFLEFVRSRGLQPLPTDKSRGLSLICQMLGNESLALMLLSSGVSSEGAGLEVSDIDSCASQFHSYSVSQLRALPIDTLSAILASPSLEIESEDALLQALVELGSEYFGLWCFVEVQFLTDEGLALFIETLPYEALSVDIWSKLGDRVKGVADQMLRRRRCRLLRTEFRSEILTELPPLFAPFHTKQWDLLYRATVDGFQASDFHRKCNNHRNTVTIILTTNGSIFGGFTPCPWDSTDGQKADPQRESFLFTIKNPHGIEARKFPLVKKRNAILSHQGYGPVFGNNDLLVTNESNTKEYSYTNLGCSYLNDTGMGGQQLFTGGHTFLAKEIEVFELRS